jgi:Uma2 family endonuclease
MSSIPLHKTWTQDEFLEWAEAQSSRYEFDGEQPMAMSGSTVAHEVIMHRLHRALDRRLPEDGPCQVLGPTLAVATVHAVRYPDALITCTPQELTSRRAAGPVTVFEIISESTAAIDRILKVREYATVSSVLRYVMLESTLVGVTVLSRKRSDELWGSVITLAAEDVLQLPEVGIEIPVVELYRGLSFPTCSAQA